MIAASTSAFPALLRKVDRGPAAAVIEDTRRVFGMFAYAAAEVKSRAIE